ncbi:MAG: DMT family transporter, partial [Chloroflexota bacterium]
MEKDTRNGLMFVIAASVGYSLFPIFTKTIYNISDMGEIDLTIWRFAFAIPLMWVGTYVWMRVTKPPKLEKPLPRLKLALTGIFAVAAALAGFFGLRYVDVGIYIVLFFTYPVMTAVINTFLGEPLSRRGWLALALTMTGVVLTVINPQMFSGDSTILIRPLGIW